MTADPTRENGTQDIAGMSAPVAMGGERLFQTMLASQAFWVTVAVVLICVVMFIAYPRAFGSAENIYNTTRNFSFIAIIAIGETLVILTGGIDLSVGSVMAIAGIVLGMLMADGHSYWFSALFALLAAGGVGLFNGVMISYFRLSAFVVTLATLSIGRSLALAISNNKMFYEFGPDQGLLLQIGGGSSAGIANSLWITLLLMVVIGFVLKFTAWGRHIYAIGSNEAAARLTGVNVDFMKVSVYVMCSMFSGISAILIVGWLGSVTNALGQTYELRVIASSVIGGVNLLGGEGGAYGTVVGAILIEVIRNTLNMAGVDPYWQGTFVGVFILFAVLLERVRGVRSN
jgi:ribose transport system permease protein